MSEENRRKALESLIFLTEKRDGQIKGRACANGSKQRQWMDKRTTTSPTVALESILLTCVIDAKEERDVATVDIPNAFIQTDNEGEIVIMKVRGQLAEILCSTAPEIYQEYMTKENGQPVLYLEVLKALYGLLQSALLFYKKLRKDLEDIGFEVNPYNPCVVNMLVNGKQLTVT